MLARTAVVFLCLAEYVDTGNGFQSLCGLVHSLATLCSYYDYLHTYYYNQGSEGSIEVQ